MLEHRCIALNQKQKPDLIQCLYFALKPNFYPVSYAWLSFIPIFSHISLYFHSGNQYFVLIMSLFFILFIWCASLSQRNEIMRYLSFSGLFFIEHCILKIMHVGSNALFHPFFQNQVLDYYVYMPQLFLSTLHSMAHRLWDW